MSPLRAPVRPRVVAPETGDVLPLEDIVEAWLGGEEPGVICILGEHGSGRSTALAHLEAVIPPQTRLHFVDDSGKAMGDISAIDPDRLTFYAGPMQLGTLRPLLELPLAPWGRDELMEYLLATHPDQCGSVLQRLADSPHFVRLHGLPELCRIVLDRMADDEQLTSPFDALRQEVADSLTGRTRIESVQTLVLGQSCQRQDLVSRAQRDIEFNPALKRLLRLDLVLEVLLSDAVVASLRKNRRAEILEHSFNESTIELIAEQIDDDLYSRLVKHVEGRDRDLHAMAASLLHASQREWRPNPKRLPNLSGAFLRGAQWSGIDLTRGELSVAKLDGSDFAHAVLTRARAGGTSFRGACLRSADLEFIRAEAANFADTDLIQAKLTNAQLPSATLLRADLTGATLIGACLNGATLRDAVFAHANLQTANLASSDIEGADFTGADLSAAVLTALPLCKASLSGAVFVNARMIGCNLEGVELPSARYRGSVLQSALLTGSRMPDADFSGARLDGAGLADIDWPGADLTDVSFNGASFHLGSSRSGLVDSPLASEGTRTGFYTDDYHDQSFRAPEEIRKANLCGADLTGAKVTGTDWYLVDLRGALYTPDQRSHFAASNAILD